jgi:hypothetical protein
MPQIALNRELNKAEQDAYMRICHRVRERFGSYHSIALRIFTLTGEEITGETVRNWFLAQKIPTDYCFVVWHMMEMDFSIETLLPWMKQFNNN